MALTDDPTFDGTYSIPPPAGSGLIRSAVRYDPGNMNIFLPAGIVGHPSYPRMTVQITIGAALYAAAMGLFLLGWRRKHGRLKVPPADRGESAG